MSEKIWLVTGCATGFGRAIAEAALAQGHKVAVTDRNLAAVEDFALRYPETALPLGLDVTNSDQIAAAVDARFRNFERIDVLVNNAGYAVQQAVAEAAMPSVRGMWLACAGQRSYHQFRLGRRPGLRAVHGALCVQQIRGRGAERRVGR
ncbi:MAG: SDR family NAD(P)-dependent oxidoreductase [Sphingomonadales bacterium]|nr:SDR family NAD(P)-dependent oxidoreductase [Sphingomonadales bacterium]